MYLSSYDIKAFTSSQGFATVYTGGPDPLTPDDKRNCTGRAHALATEKYLINQTQIRDPLVVDFS